VTCPDVLRVAGGERRRTRVNEPKTEPAGSTAADNNTRFRGLRTLIHHWPQASVTWADRRCAFAGEPSGTGVNETKTEPRGSVRDLMCWPPAGRPPRSAEAISWTLNPEQSVQGYTSSVQTHLRRSATSAQRCRPSLSASDRHSPLPFRSQNRTPQLRPRSAPAGTVSPASAGAAWSAEAERVESRPG
jgi:hypothetical protein